MSDLADILRQSRQKKEAMKARGEKPKDLKDAIMETHTRITWLRLCRNDDGAYYIDGAQNHCPGNTFYTNNIGAIMVNKEGEEWIRCYSEGWVTNDRRWAYVRYSDYVRDVLGDEVTVTDTATMEVSRG